MILCKLKELENYSKLNDGFNKIIEFIKNNDLINLNCGKYDLGDDDYLNLVCDKATENNGVMESHRDYVDVQFLVVGKEKLLYSHVNDCTPTTEYNSADDYILYTNLKSFGVEVESGYCAVLFPNDAHKMYVEIGNSDSTKAIFKIKNSLKLKFEAVFSLFGKREHKI